MNFETKITEIMSIKLTTVHPKDSIETAEVLFKRIDKHILPVVVNQELRGVLLRRDFKNLAKTKTYIRTSFGDKITIQNMIVEDYMTREVSAFGTEMTIKDAIQFFIENTQYYIPIIDQNKLVGFITPHDVFKFIMKADFK